MAVTQAMRDLLARLDSATNQIAAKLDKLADQIEAGGMSAEDEAAAAAELHATATRLEALGADETDPIPAEPTEPTEPT